MWFSQTTFCNQLTMRTINLLPWREMLRMTKKQQFLKQLVFSLLTIIGVLILLHLGLQYRIVHWQQKNNSIQKKSLAFAQQIKIVKNLQQNIFQIQQRLKMLQKIAVENSQYVELLNQLMQQLPENLLLTDLSIVSNQLVLSGLSESNAEIVALMQRLTTFPGIKHPKLIEAKAITENAIYRYHFVIKSDVL